MTERFEIFPQNVAKDGTLIIIQKGLKLKGFKLYNINDVVELLNTLNEENEQLKAHNQYLIELLEHTGAIVEIQKGDEE